MTEICFITSNDTSIEETIVQSDVQETKYFYAYD